MSCILAPVNFSQASDNAAFYAASLAKQLNLPLILLHVVPVPLSIPPVPLPGEMFDQLRQDAYKQLQQLAATFNEVIDIKARLEVELGSLGFQLETAIRNFTPEIVIMGISRESASRVIFSSNVFESLKQLSVPLVVVGEDVQYEPVKKIAMAFDFDAGIISLPSDAVLRYCNLLNCKLDIVHVNKSANKPDIEKVRALWNLLPGLETDVQFIDDEIVEEGLHRYFEMHEAQQLMLLPKHHGFFEFHTSETKRLLWKFKVPVVVIKESK